MAVGATAMALSFALAACGGGTSGSSAATTSTNGGSNAAGGTSKPISVGFVLPLTGNFAANANLEEDGFKLGLKQFCSTVDGHKITVHYSDSQGTPST
ncbi:MAG: hypothetical protein ACRDYZ_04685, partial [Acidimicrobiales bacterium]